jgi:hypothetical protein
MRRSVSRKVSKMRGGLEHETLRIRIPELKRKNQRENAGINNTPTPSPRRSGSRRSRSKSWAAWAYNCTFGKCFTRKSRVNSD